MSSIDETEIIKNKFEANGKHLDGKPNCKIDQNKRMINRLKEKLQIKLSALDAHMNKNQEDSKVTIIFFK